MRCVVVAHQATQSWFESGRGCCGSIVRGHGLGRARRSGAGGRHAAELASCREIVQALADQLRDLADGLRRQPGQERFITLLAKPDHQLVRIRQFRADQASHRGPSSGERVVDRLEARAQYAQSPAHHPLRDLEAGIVGDQQRLPALAQRLGDQRGATAG